MEKRDAIAATMIYLLIAFMMIVRAGMMTGDSLKDLSEIPIINARE